MSSGLTTSPSPTRSSIGRPSTQFQALEEPGLSLLRLSEYLLTGLLDTIERGIGEERTTSVLARDFRPRDP